MANPSTKPQFVNWGCVGPALIYLGVALGIVAGAITLERRAHHAMSAPAANTHVSANSGLANEHARCQALDRKAEDDTCWLGAWTEDRRRFLGDALIGKGFRP
jgi:conjugative transfer region protein TrbK